MTGFIISWFFTKDIIANKATFNAPMFIVAMIGLALSFGLYLVTRMIQNKLLLSASFRTTAKMREVASKKLLYMPISYHDKNKVGDQISTLTNDINNIALTMTQLFNETSGKIFKVIFFCDIYVMLLTNFISNSIACNILILCS
nr:ABC transporter transmembrane domain-containing protein [Mycoplasmopsis bovis]